MMTNVVSEVHRRPARIRRISRVASEPAGSHALPSQPEHKRITTPHANPLVVQLSRLASQHHASEYNRVKFGPNGSPLPYVPYSVQMPDHYREMQAHQLRCAGQETWWLHEDESSNGDTVVRSTFRIQARASLRMSPGTLVSVDLHKELSAAITSSIIPAPKPDNRHATIPTPQPQWQTSETHPIVISTMIPSEILPTMSSQLRLAAKRYPVVLNIPASRSLDRLISKPVDVLSTNVQQVYSPVTPPTDITSDAKPVLSPPQSLAKSSGLSSRFWVHPTVRRAFLGGDEAGFSKRHTKPASFVEQSSVLQPNVDYISQSRPKVVGYLSHGMLNRGNSWGKGETPRARVSTAPPVLPIIDVAIPAVPSIPPSASTRLIGNLYMSSCPGKKVRLDGPVKGRNTVCRDLLSDLSRIKSVGVSCIICCLDDNELESLGVSWQDYAQTANDLAIDVLRIPIPEGLAPLDAASLDAHLAKVIHTYTFRGSAILVHCRGGVGRAGIIACCWMLKLGLCGWLEPPSPSLTAAASNCELVDEATLHLVKRVLSVVRKRRSPKAVETYEQVKFLVDYIKFLQERASDSSTGTSPRTPNTDFFADWETYIAMKLKGQKSTCRRILKCTIAAHIANGQTYEAQQATIKTLLTLAGSNLESDADSESFALTPSTVDPSEIPASREAYLKRLSQNANAAAASLFCGSILAGHTSEADEYGDVAIALGHGTFGPGHELDVINALGLGNLAQRDQGPEPLELSQSTSIPSTVNVPADTGPEVQELSLQLQELHERHAFCFEKDHLGVYFLVGHHNEYEWVGLVGVGVHT